MYHNFPRIMDLECNLRIFKNFYCILIVTLCTFLVFVTCKTEDIKHRVMADKEHYANGEHQADYDHEAFLGEEASDFDNLTPEESKRRLGIIVDKIDRNNDSKVSEEELKIWIQYTQQRYLVSDVDKQWRTHNLSGKEDLTWDDYRKTVYGFSHDYEATELDKEEDDGDYSYKTMLDRDKRRWNVADVDGNGALNREEFAAFLHPEETSYMRDIVILETMEDIDKDKDGKISLEEYIGDMYHGSDEEEDQLPDWVRNEKEQFSTHRDKNKDGFLDKHEVEEWVLPQGFDPAEAEARHLIFEADSDGDKTLTKEEILDKYDLFVGSQATDFGEALSRHDEF